MKTLFLFLLISIFSATPKLNTPTRVTSDMVLLDQPVLDEDAAVSCCGYCVIDYELSHSNENDAVIVVHIDNQSGGCTSYKQLIIPGSSSPNSISGQFTLYGNGCGALCTPAIWITNYTNQAVDYDVTLSCGGQTVDVLSYNETNRIGYFGCLLECPCNG